MHSYIGLLSALHVLFLTAKAAFPNERQKRSIDSTVQKALKDWHTPGLAIAIVNGENTWAKGYGLASLPNTPVTTETLFYMGSTTKSFTAAAVSRLIDNSSTTGLKWTTTINSIIPEDFVLSDDWATKHITLEDALSHRTGYPRHDLAWQDTPKAFARALRYLSMTAEPRTRFQYNNHMFTIVGYVIEVVSKMALRDVFKSWLWDPLGMTSTYYSLQEAKTTNKLATPYWWNDRTQKYVTLPHADIPQSGGAGVIISNVVDYAKYLRSMINKTLPISPAGHTALTNAHMLMAESGAPYFTGPMWYGLGWQGAVFKNEVMYHHNGAVDGFLATMAFFPGRKFGVVITSNAFSPTHDIVFWQVINDFFDVPQKDRVNISALATQGEQQRAFILANAKALLFPALPSPPVPRPAPLEAFLGVFNHPAYQNISLGLCDAGNSTVNTGCQIKTGVMETLGQRYHAEAEHVSGNFWLGRVFYDNHDPDLAANVLRIQFEITGGVVSRVGVEQEQELFIWYHRVS